MEWNQELIDRIFAIFKEKWQTFAGLDRKNRSARWNAYLKQLGCNLAHDLSKRRVEGPTTTMNDLVRLINLRNSEVADGILISNPDRAFQFIVLSRDLAERCLMLGMP
jgi:hypothetical protein